MTNESVFVQKFAVAGGDFVHAGEVSWQVRNLLKELGLSIGIVLRVAIATYEAEMNIIMYAQEGRVTLSVTPGRILVVAEDSGPGIEDIELAMTEGYSTATLEMRELGFGAGMGLANIKKNTDALSITSTVGQGTRLEMTILSNGQRP